MAVSRLYSSGVAIPLLLALTLAGFYSITAALGLDFAMMRGLGLLLGPFQGGSFVSGLSFDLLQGVQWRILLDQTPVIVTIVAVAMLGTLLNASGLELAIGRELDFERELKGVGVANIAAGLVGGLGGFHILAETLLARRFGLVGVSAGLGLAFVMATVLFFGADMLAYLPIGLFAAVVFYLGFDLLLTAIWDHGMAMPRVELAIVLAMPVIALVLGFMPAVGFGISVAALLFGVAYSGVDATRLITTAANFRARVERSPQDSAPGRQTDDAAFGLGADTATLLQKYGTRVDLAAGEALFTQGTQSDHLVFLQSGRLRATVTDCNGDTRIVSRFLPGAIVGEIAYYSGVNRSATVTAETKSTALRMDGAERCHSGGGVSSRAGQSFGHAPDDDDAAFERRRIVAPPVTLGRLTISVAGRCPTAPAAPASHVRCGFLANVRPRPGGTGPAPDCKPSPARPRLEPRRANALPRLTAGRDTRRHPPPRVPPKVCRPDTAVPSDRHFWRQRHCAPAKRCRRSAATGCIPHHTGN